MSLKKITPKKAIKKIKSQPIIPILIAMLLLIGLIIGILALFGVFNSNKNPDPTIKLPRSGQQSQEKEQIISKTIESANLAKKNADSAAIFFSVAQTLTKNAKMAILNIVSDGEKVVAKLDEINRPNDKSMVTHYKNIIYTYFF